MKEQILNYTRTRSVKEPTRANKNDAGIDFYVPNFTPDFINDLKIKNPNISSIMPGSHSYYIIENEKKILIGAHERILIPSGIKIKGHEGIALNAHNKSGVGSKKGLDRLAEVVDEGYQGEIHINLVNTSNYMIEILEGEKIVQWLEVHVDNSTLVEVSQDELFPEISDRGANGFGSSNKTK
jgi:deoxyuridine 5'-triphosphate nucleotidohydrolase